jgi:hypothetical protein
MGNCSDPLAKGEVGALRGRHVRFRDAQHPVAGQLRSDHGRQAIAAPVLVERLAGQLPEIADLVEIVADQNLRHRQLFYHQRL